MEMVLDVYKRPFDPLRPVVCMDESPKQLIAETRVPIPGSPGRVARHDYEYRRCGVCTVFLACEPLVGRRMVTVTETRTKWDWACFIEEIADQYKSAEKITLVPDYVAGHIIVMFPISLCGLTVVECRWAARERVGADT